MTSWVKRRVLLPVRNALKNGLSQKRLAVSMALGITIGLIPFYGISTLIVGLLAYMLRLDFIVMQAVHYIVHPLQIALIIPFFKAGNYFAGNQSVSFSVKEYIALFKDDFWLAVNQLWKLNLLGILVWAMIAIPLFYGLYNLFIYSIKRYSHQFVRKPVYTNQ